jgi:hypothetical protein
MLAAVPAIGTLTAEFLYQSGFKGGRTGYCRHLLRMADIG